MPLPVRSSFWVTGLYLDAVHVELAEERREVEDALVAEFVIREVEFFETGGRERAGEVLADIRAEVVVADVEREQRHVRFEPFADELEAQERDLGCAEVQEHQGLGYRGVLWSW